MSRFDESAIGAETTRLDLPRLSPEFVGRYPNMADVFSGKMNEDGTKFARHPGSIILFFEGDRFKFVCSPRSSSRIAFGSGTNGVGGFTEIEQALEMGHFEWKLRSGQRRS